MSATPHLLHRLGRWWHLKLLQARIDQLASLAAQLEAEINTTHDALASVRMELTQCRTRLAAATAPHRNTGQPFTRGL